MLRPILILFKSRLKLQLKRPLTLFFEILTPFTFGIAFLTQIYVLYFVNPTAFSNLSRSDYILGFTATQIAYFLKAFTIEGSLYRMSKSIYDAELDLYLIRPVNLAIFKYFRQYWIGGLVMIPTYTSVFIYELFQSHINAYTVLKIITVIICSMIIQANLTALIHGCAFFFRNIDHLERMITKITSISFNKPPEIFPATFNFFLTYVIPAMIISSVVFDIIRSKDTTILWVAILFWTAALSLANKMLWSQGLKKYESVS